MSLLSTDRLSVFLSPSDVAAVRLGRAGRIVEKIRRPANGADGDWSSAVETFGALLAESGCRRVRVVVSSVMTSYELMAWRADLADREEEEAAASAAFAETFGGAAAEWTVRVCDEPPGAARVAAAIETRLLGAIERAAAAAHVKLVAIEPWLIAAANAWRRHLGGEQACWFVLRESQRACLAVIENGRWRWLRCIRADADWAEHLPQTIEHEMLLAGIEAPLAVLVFAPAEPELAVPGGTRLSFRSLRLEERAGFSPLMDGAFAPALPG